MSKRVFNNPEPLGSSEASKNKRKKLDEEHTLPLQEYKFTRNCKVSTLLKEPFKIYKQLFRITAEEFTLLRRDAIHFVTFIVLNWTASNYNLANFPNITFFGRQKECEERYKSLICPTCLDGKKIWPRDVNTAINIKGIMMDYINSQYDINSGHTSLCHGTPPAVILPTATS